MRLPVGLGEKQEEQEIRAYAVSHLPIIREFAAKLGIVGVTDTLIPAGCMRNRALFFPG